jgi:hypothetical protein
LSDLSVPATAEELYLARGKDVADARPILSGDVFQNVEIPGVEGEAGLAMVLAHPCSMRHGAHLRSRIHMARVQTGPEIPLAMWDGNYGAMPLPDLCVSGDLRERAVFDLSGRVATELLTRDKRIACLDTKGVLLLMQRRTYDMTRVAVDLETIHESIAAELEEADLLEEWTRHRLPGGASGNNLEVAIREQETLFDEVLRQNAGGVPLRLRLKDPTTRPGVRRHVLQAMRK